MRSRLKAHINTETIIKLLQGKQERVLVQWLCNSVQLAFCSSERNLVALGRNGKLISRAHVLRPASGRQGLCDSAWTPTWVFVCLRVFMHVQVYARTCAHWLFKATHSRRAWLTAEGSGEALGNKFTLVQPELTRLCLQLCFSRQLPLGSPTINRRIRLKNWQKYLCSAAFLIPRCAHACSYKLTSSGNSRYCRQIPEKMFNVSTSCLWVLTKQAHHFLPRPTPHSFDSTDHSMMQHRSRHQQGERLPRQRSWVKYCWQIVLIGGFYFNFEAFEGFFFQTDLFKKHQSVYFLLQIIKHKKNLNSAVD